MMWMLAFTYISGAISTRMIFSGLKPKSKTRSVILNLFWLPVLWFVVLKVVFSGIYKQKAGE